MANLNNSAVTPPWLSEAAHQLMGVISLDPASSENANRIIKAERIYTRRDNGLKIGWHNTLYIHGLSRIWLNPPGGRTVQRESRVCLWWNKLLEESESPAFGHALFLAFNIEACRLTQTYSPKSLLSFETCVFKKRIDFHHPRSLKVMRGNRYMSSVTYLPGRIDKSAQFHKIFGKLGEIVRTQNSLSQIVTDTHRQLSRKG